MNIDEFNKRHRGEVENFKHGFRTDTSAFLIWFLRNIFCLEEETSISSVCDGPNDKGIDGIWVDDESEEIYIFQTKFSPNDNRDQGDSDIRNFIGAKEWFNSESNVNTLLISLANQELKNLIINLKIEEKVSAGYDLILVFITNKIFDRNANEYLKTNNEIEAYDVNELFKNYTYISKEEVTNSPKILNLSEMNAIEYNNVEGNKTAIVAIPATEIVKLDGIQDHTLFSRNVRYWVGKTRVNKGIKKTLESTDEHSKFFLYHNGITIVCNKFELDKTQNQLRVEDYQVINGCQSILSFFENMSILTDDIYVLSKIIEVEPHSQLIPKITYYANNQNSISLKDLKSNDRVQIGLQNKFKEVFSNQVFYRIKRGESAPSSSEIIDMDFAAQLIESFYLKEPYGTHLKAKIFSDRYPKIFSRKITPQKIYLAHLIYKIIEENADDLDRAQLRTYGLAKFAILRFIREILENDNLGKELIEDPDSYITGQNLGVLKSSIQRLFKMVALDINAYIDGYVASQEGFFDYKNLFKNKNFVDEMNNAILTAHKKDFVRHPEDAFEKIFEDKIEDLESSVKKIEKNVAKA